MKQIWEDLWDAYKEAWKDAWNQYKTLVGPFIKGTATYIWLLVSGFIDFVTVGLYESGKLILNKIIEWFNNI